MHTAPRRLGFVALSCLLTVSIGLKVVLAMSPAGQQRLIDSESIAAQIRRSGFGIVWTSGPQRLPSVEARSGACDVLVTRAAPQGWNRSIIRQTAGSRRLVYAYDGALYDEHPLLRTASRYYWELLKRRSGLPAHMPAVLAIAWNPDCGAPPAFDLSSLQE